MIYTEICFSCYSYCNKTKDAVDYYTDLTEKGKKEEKMVTGLV